MSSFCMFLKILKPYANVGNDWHKFNQLVLMEFHPPRSSAFFLYECTWHLSAHLLSFSVTMVKEWNTVTATLSTRDINIYYSTTRWQSVCGSAVGLPCILQEHSSTGKTLAIWQLALKASYKEDIARHKKSLQSMRRIKCHSSIIQ